MTLYYLTLLCTPSLLRKKMPREKKMKQVSLLDRDAFLNLENLLLHTSNSTTVHLSRSWKVQKEACAKISD